jgi:hypothetical protein
MGKRSIVAAAANQEKKEKKKKLAAAATEAADAPAAEAPASTWHDDGDTPFPRGGGSAITALERREARLDAQRDFLFEQEAADARKKRGKKRDAEEVEEEEDVVMGALNAGDEIARADALRATDLTVGLRLLGAVSDVSSSKVTIQLPCQLMGRCVARSSPPAPALPPCLVWPSAPAAWCPARCRTSCTRR